MKYWMRILTGLVVSAPWFLLVGLVVADQSAPPTGRSPSDEASETAQESPGKQPQQVSNETGITPENGAPQDVQIILLISGLTIFVLAVLVGLEVISKVPTMLHPPLMSGSNAISGITVVGALLVTGTGDSLIGSLLGTLAVILAMTNVTGGFMVTHRMLSTFQKK